VSAQVTGPRLHYCNAGKLADGQVSGKEESPVPRSPRKRLLSGEKSSGTEPNQLAGMASKRWQIALPHKGFKETVGDSGSREHCQ